MGQQFYVIRNNPAPGTPAFKAKQERDARHGKTVTEDPLKPVEDEAPKPPPRQQPRNQARSQRKKKPAGPPKRKPDITSKNETDKDGTP